MVCAGVILFCIWMLIGAGSPHGTVYVRPARQHYKPGDYHSVEWNKPAGNFAIDVTARVHRRGPGVAYVAGTAIGRQAGGAGPSTSYRAVFVARWLAVLVAAALSALFYFIGRLLTAGPAPTAGSCSR
jgi:hypothetical protein